MIESKLKDSSNMEMIIKWGDLDVVKNYVSPVVVMIFR